MLAGTGQAEKQLLLHQAKLYGQRIDGQLEKAWEEPPPSQSARVTVRAFVVRASSASRCGGVGGPLQSCSRMSDRSSGRNATCAGRSGGLGW